MGVAKVSSRNMDSGSKGIEMIISSIIEKASYFFNEAASSWLLMGVIALWVRIAAYAPGGLLIDKQAYRTKKSEINARIKAPGRFSINLGKFEWYLRWCYIVILYRTDICILLWIGGVILLKAVSMLFIFIK